MTAQMLRDAEESGSCRFVSSTGATVRLSRTEPSQRIRQGSVAACPTCGRRMARWGRPADWAPPDGAKLYYAYWDECANSTCPTRVVLPPGGAQTVAR